MILDIIYISGKRRNERPLLDEMTSVRYKELCISPPNKTFLTPLITSIKFMKLVKTYHPHIVLIEYAGLKYLLISFISIFLKKIKLVVRQKGNYLKELEDIKYLPFSKRIKRYINLKPSVWILRHAQGIIPNSSWISEAIKKNIGKKRNIYVVPNCYRETEIKKGNGVQGPKNKILTITNFNFYQKIEPLMNTVPRVYPFLTDLHLDWVILGGGVHLDRFRKIARPYNDRIKVKGWQKPGKYYKESILFLYISGLDGFPIVLLEASLNSLPIIINTDCPSADFIIDGYNGLHVDRFDDENLLKQISCLTFDGNYRGFIGKNANAFVKNHFSAGTVSRLLENALLDIST